MNSLYINYRSSAIHCLRIGSGPKAVLAFHGFSEDSAGFLELAPAFGVEYTVYAFDFPWHGRTRWREKRPLSPDDLEAIVQQLLLQEGIQRFSMFGFSMGGRLCLCLAEAFAGRLDALFLAAPDGIRTHKVFNVAVYPVWGRWLFRIITRRPGLFFYIVKLLYRNRRISRFLYEFTVNHMDTREKRERIFQTWVSLKHFVPDLSGVKQVLNTHEVSVHLFFGEYDKVIRPGVGRVLISGLNHATLDIVPKGHKLVSSALVPFLKPYL